MGHNNVMNDKLYEPILLFSIGKLEKDKIAPLFQALVESGEIWDLPSDNFLNTAGMLLEGGFIGLSAREKRIKGMNA